MTEGYGANWKDWEAYLTREFGERPKDVSYGNWYPFF